VNEDLLELHEAIEVGSAGPIRADGLVPIYVIRPGIGRGRGKHLYEAPMLQEAVTQGRFAGWKMYVDHQSPEARRASGGLPRSVRDLGGIIKEAWWDGSVPADPEKGWGQGAVVGLAKPTRLIASLIEDDPDLVEASISASATSVKPVQRGRDTVYLVEGIRPRGSVDWVTEAGAGGKVAPLIESLVESDDFEEEYEMLEGEDGNTPVDTDELVEWLADRPEILGAALELAEVDAEDVADKGADELAELTAKYVKKFKGNRAMALKAAKRELAGAQEGRHDGGGNVDGAEMFELLQEALESDEGRASLDEAVKRSFARVIAPSLRELVEAAIEDERDLLHAEGRAEAERIVEVRDLRDIALEVIGEARLPEPFKKELREKYAFVDGKPAHALDVLAEEDEDGKVVKTAEQVLREDLEADVERKREQAAELRPTRVRGQGETARRDPAEGGDGEAEKRAVEEGRKTTGSPRTDAVLQEAGIQPDEDLYAGILG
jgi:hypothetical protein